MRLTAARQQQQQQPQHPPPRLLALLDRGLCKLARTLTDLVNTHPWSCYACGMVAAHMEATVGYLTSHDASVLGTNILQRYTVQCLNFVYAVCCVGLCGVLLSVMGGARGGVPSTYPLGGLFSLHELFPE